MVDSTSWDHLVEAHQLVAADSSSRIANGKAPVHEPKAAILACSDARVPPSVIFNQPAGNLFVIRIAGNTAVPSALASLDYAVASLDVDLVIVLGHTSCGAVTAAAGGTCGGHLKPIVAPICEIAASHPDATIDEMAALNVAKTMNDIANHTGPAGLAITNSTVEIRGAIHDLGTGELIAVPNILNQTTNLVETP